MKIAKIFSLSIAILSLNIFSVFAQSNVTGWGKAQWDMTLEQVKKEYPQIYQADRDTIDKQIKFCLAIKRFIEEKCKTVTVYHMDNFIIGSYPFQIHFLYAENKLKEIQLKYQGEEEKVNSAYVYTLESLTSRYGKPSSDLLIMGKQTWRTPDGTIELNIAFDKSLRIVYAQVEQNL